MGQCAAASLLVVLALGLVGAGCQHIYREAEEIYPPDPCARLKLRIDQARQAREKADRAAARLRDRSAKGMADKTLEPDVDRLEMAAREFARRTAAVSDAVASCEQSDLFAAEMQRLRLLSEQLFEAVQLIRSDGLSATLPLLDRLLQSPPQP